MYNRATCDLAFVSLERHVMVALSLIPPSDDSERRRRMYGSSIMGGDRMGRRMFGSSIMGGDRMGNATLNVA